MKKIIILSSDTLHHRYFINNLQNFYPNLLFYIFETTSVSFKFKTGPTFEKKQYDYENKLFIKNIDKEINKNKIKRFKNINSKESLKFIKKIDPDLGLVFGTRKLKTEVIKLFKDGLVNAHRGDPEQYRGLDSDIWAMYHNDFENIYSTIHYINKDLDSGNIIYKKKLKIDKNTRAYKVQGLTTIIMTQLFIKFLKDYSFGKVIAKKQNKSGRYYSKIPYDLKNIAIKKFDKYCKQK